MQRCIKAPLQQLRKQAGEWRASIDEITIQIKHYLEYLNTYDFYKRKNSTAWSLRLWFRRLGLGRSLYSLHVLKGKALVQRIPRSGAATDSCFN